jgi:twitching motility protein PilT
MTAAETGHLVVSTLHTNDAKSAIERILDIFPSNQQNQIRIQLASCLVGILSQQLVPKKDGKGRVLAAEVLVKSPSIEHCIRTGESDEIPTLMASSDDYYKMQTMNQDLHNLFKSGQISRKEALACSNNPDDLKLKLSGFDRKESYNIQSVDVEPEE